jgi:hypothetical protein
METNNLQNIWKNVDSEINLKSAVELNQILSVKIRKTMNKFLVILGIDILVCVGLILFLVITAFNRQGDILYQVNNLMLGLITLTALLISILSWKRIQNNKFNLSVKDWLEQRIKLLSGWLLGKYSKLYITIIPILLVLINLSIHVYYEYKPFVTVMNDGESIYGLITGFVIGLFVSLYAMKKIRNYQINNLEYLKTLYSSLQ